MHKAERIIAALVGKTPDMVPYIYNTMMRGVQERIIGRKITEPTIDGLNVTGWIGPPTEKSEVVPSLTAIPAVAQRLNLDAIQIQVLPPIYARRVISGDDACVAKGLIDSAAALAAVKMPDPDDEKLLRAIEEMIQRYKGDLALGARVRLGASPSLLSMGMENISLFYADEDDTLTKTVEMFTDWSRRMNKNLSEMDFDFFWCFDDIAYATSMMLSPAMFRKIFKENMRKAASTISKPWIYHSDGNFQPVLDDILEIGAAGIHPIEKAAMNTRWLKENYGARLCLVGNIDIDYTLAKGTEAEVEDEVRERIQLLGPGGRYIISDSNSIPNWCQAENIIAMSKAVEKYRRIY